jgi:alkanesulfonate monooxygenase SsuD/methylene tetrahydromethanopterin reductase-like flavin-dependent oxidoreductase (luciferase family)
LLNSFVTARGHWIPVETVAEIATQMQQRVNEFCADGFIVLPSDLEHGLDGFLNSIVPHLKRQGAFRTDYEGRTLRAHLGLKN